MNPKLPAQNGGGPEAIVTTANAPFDSPMDIVLRLGLGRMKRHDRIGIVMTQHASVVGGIGPLLLAQGLDQSVVPLSRGLLSPSPIVLRNVQDMIAEILELLI